MKKSLVCRVCRFTLSAFCLMPSAFCLAQAKEFDMTSTQALVEQNKDHYSDNTTAKTSTVVISAQQTVNTGLQKQITQQCNKLDKVFTSITSIVNDAQIVTDVLTAINEITAYQKAAATLVEQYPWLSPWYVQQQTKILSDAEDVYGLIALVVIQIGDVNKIDNSQRRLIFYGIRDEENNLVQKNSDLVDMLKSLIQAYKQLIAIPGQFKDNNQQIMQQVMAGYKL